MGAQFQAVRRQQFLTEPYFNGVDKFLAESVLHWRDNLQGVAKTDAENRMLALNTHANHAYMRFSLRYTGGISLDLLRTELTEVVEAYERYQKALEVFEAVPEVTPLPLEDLGDYERCVQLLGLCILLYRPDLLARVAALVDPAYQGEDTLYEELLVRYLPDRAELDEWYHAEPYNPLIHALFEEDRGQTAELVNQYCKGWYSAFKHVPWHDGHLRIRGTDGDYFGYWAFEAGAVAYLLDLDDSNITHMVYPKDLVAWARANKHLSEEASNDTQHGRCEAGQLCPRDGFWFTPAQADSRRFFKAGEVMPSVGGDYGATIWQWDLNQGAPNP